MGVGIDGCGCMGVVFVPGFVVFAFLRALSTSPSLALQPEREKG